MVFTHNGEKNKLFCNNGNSNNWINIKLNGTNTNKCAIGSKVRLKCEGIWQMRELLPVSGFGSQNSIRLHFGLGNASSIDSLIIDWPSGYTQTISSGLNVNTFNTIEKKKPIYCMESLLTT